MTNHRKARTAQLHDAYNTMARDAALTFAVTELKYTKAGAASWFSHWAKLEAEENARKEAAKAAKPKRVRPSRSKAAVAARAAARRELESVSQ